MTDTDRISVYRGYIGSRPVAGNTYPQRVQNLVIRDYAMRRGLELQLSLTEYAMRNCFMMLHDALAELEQIDGLILFSLFMLPSKPSQRRNIYKRVLDCGGELHAALEEMTLASSDDVQRFEDVLQLEAWLPLAPGEGRWAKS